MAVGGQFTVGGALGDLVSQGLGLGAVSIQGEGCTFGEDVRG